MHRGQADSLGVTSKPAPVRLKAPLAADPRLPRGSQQPDVPGDIIVLEGRTAVLAWGARLKQLATQCGQPGAADDLPYHLSTRFAANKVPTLVLISIAQADRASAHLSPSVEGICAAILVFQYRIAHIRSHVFSTSDTTGRRTVIGPPDCRAELAALACRELVRRGAEIVLLSLQANTPSDSTLHAFQAVLGNGRGNGAWSLVERDTPLYLPLRSSFDETLATIGKKTRTNLRYYRRRAEKELGCVFVPEVKMSVQEFVAVSREAAFPVEEEIARWRYESLGRIEDPLFCGVRDSEGRWLSLAAGRRAQGHVELDWQSNRADCPTYSLSTVLRAYLIEYEVNRGSTRLYIEGTPSPLQNSFVSERIADVTLYRGSLRGWLIRRLAKWLFPERIQLAQVLRDQTMVWRTW